MNKLLTYGWMMLAAAALLTGCQAGFKKHESGLLYRIVENNKEAMMPVVGNIVTIEMTCTSEAGVKVEDSGVFRTQLKEPSKAAPSVEQAILLMHQGDSIQFKINAEEYFTLAKRERLPEKIGADEMLTFNLRLINIATVEEFKQERKTLRVAGEKEEEELMLGFIKRANITVEPTSSGLYHVVMRPGNGEKPRPGKKVTVNYLGYYIDGTPFDNSYERGEPYTFMLGMRDVIQGWDEGISLMTKGEKAKFVIPSYLAYGANPTNGILPYSTLVFEVELLDFEK